MLERPGSRANTLPKRASYGLLAVLALVAALFAAWLVRDATTDDISFNNPPQVATEPVGGPRQGNAWCVQTKNVDRSVQVDAKRRIDRLLPEIAAVDTGPVGPDLEDFVPDEVDAGCPIGPTVYDQKPCKWTVPIPQLTTTVCARQVKEPGRYMFLIYILPRTEIERLAGTQGYRISTEESVCVSEGAVSEEYCHVLIPISVGLFLSPAELRDPSLLRFWFYELAGLRCFRPQDANLPDPTLIYHSLDSCRED